TIADTPHSIAFGSSIGIFFRFRPLWSLKIFLSIGVAGLCRCNKIAAAIGVTIHDVLDLVMSAVYFVACNVGCWTLHRPTRPHPVDDMPALLTPRITAQKATT